MRIKSVDPILTWVPSHYVHTVRIAEIALIYQKQFSFANIRGFIGNLSADFRKSTLAASVTILNSRVNPYLSNYLFIFNFIQDVEQELRRENFRRSDDAVAFDQFVGSSEAGTLPFQITPQTGILLPGECVACTLVFAPLDVYDYKVIAACRCVCMFVAFRATGRTSWRAKISRVLGLYAGVRCVASLASQYDEMIPFHPKYEEPGSKLDPLKG